MSLDGRTRPRLSSDDARAIQLGKSRRAVSHRGLRLRNKAKHPALVRRARLPGDRRAGGDAGSGRVGARAERRVSVERARRPAAVTYAPDMVRGIAAEGVPI